MGSKIHIDNKIDLCRSDYSVMIVARTVAAINWQQRFQWSVATNNKYYYWPSEWIEICVRSDDAQSNDGSRQATELSKSVYICDKYVALEIYWLIVLFGSI